MRPLMLTLTATLALMAPLVTTADVQYPTRPIKLIVLNPVGGGQDFVMRKLAQKFTDRFRYNVIIVNQPNGLGEVGKRDCADSSPDGYTLCSVADGVAAVHPAAYAAAKEKIPVDNLTPIGFVADQYFALVVRRDRPGTFAEFVEFAQTHPDELVCGSGNTTGRLGIAILNSIPGVKVRDARYNEGEPRVLLDMQAGIIDCMFSSMIPVLPHVEAGTVKALGTFGPLKNPFLPGVSPLSEMGYPAFGKLGSWYAIWAPPKMPKHLVDLLNWNLNEALGDADIAQSFATSGVSVRRGSPEDLANVTRELFAESLELICKERVELLGKTCKK